MLTTIAGLVLVVLAAFFVAWPLIAGRASEVLPSTSSDDGGSTPEKDKEQALLAIREADFDHRTGKLSDEDYAALRAELEGRALTAMAAEDAASALRAVPPGAPAAAPVAGAAAIAPQPRATAEPGGFCPACGVRFARGARFCPGCGKKLPSATQRGRRRA